MKKLLMALIGSVLLLTACTGTKSGTGATGGSAAPTPEAKEPEPAKETLIYATIDIKDYGTIELE